MTYQEHLDSLFEIQMNLLKLHRTKADEFIKDTENKALFLEPSFVINSYRRWQKALREFESFEAFCKEQGYNMNSEMTTPHKITLNEIADFIMGVLHTNTIESGMIRLMETLKSSKVEITFPELIMIKNMIEKRGYAVFQTQKEEFRASITKKGIEFAETTSFSDKETPIIIPE